MNPWPVDQQAQLSKTSIAVGLLSAWTVFGLCVMGKGLGLLAWFEGCSIIYARHLGKSHVYGSSVVRCATENCSE